MSADQAQLKAGGLVPANAKLGTEDAVDTVVARAYHHAVLPGRTVIRLTAENVAAGDDLEMATLGFGAGEDRGAVAKERKRPLGFPGWALVNDPKNARYALDVVKELKKHTRKAKSKPGHAKEGVDALADKLGKTAPHFLPSFFEEAGRAFIEHGAQSFAAAMFGKAREAEAVHALEVDEQHRVDGFLEFALAGAVTTKALTQYAKELAEHHKPDVAYAHFRQLCLQRTLGGMPPWSGMAKELRRLAKAAKLDVAAEDRAFVVEIIESPALGKAAGEFWRAYMEPLTELGKHSASARGALLNLFPTGSAHSADLDAAWLDLVEATGAVRALVANDAPAEAQASGGRAAWFDRLTAHLARDYRESDIPDRAYELLRRMAPMLIADGKPISGVGRYHQIDLDLCELALELGVQVAPAGQYSRFNLDRWSKRAGEPGHGVDPVRTAAHPAMGPLLATAVAGEIGDEPFDSVSRGKQGFLAAKRVWLEGVIDRAEKGGLLGLGEAIALITAKVKAETFSDVPDLHARFAAIDPAFALARSLRAGLMDELGWSAFEEAALELDPTGQTQLTVHGGPPALVLATSTKVIAIGPSGRLGAHDLVIPPKHELVTARFIGGQFLVVLKNGYKARGYWSGAAHDVFDSETSVWSISALVPRAAVLPDGAWIEGATAIRPGERRVPEGQGLMGCDGTTAWIGEWVGEAKERAYRWREVSASGEKGRLSWPAFIESAAEIDGKIDGMASYVLPALGIASSPLGAANGMIGIRVRLLSPSPDAESRWELVTIDGTTTIATGAPRPEHLLKLPGSDKPRLVSEESKYRAGITSTIIDPDTRVHGSAIGSGERRYSRGQVAPLPPTFWHAMTVRDEAGSRRLRVTTDADARALIDAMPAGDGSAPAAQTAAALAQALTSGATVTKPVAPTVVDGAVSPEVIANVLPEVTHRRLRTGVIGFAQLAKQYQAERDRLALERAPDKVAAKAAGSAGPDDAVLLAGLGGWHERQYNQDGRAWSQIERAAEWFASDDRKDRYVHDLPGSVVEWNTFAVSRSALAFIATAIGTPADKRKAVAELFSILARTLPAPELLRCYRAEGKLALSGEGNGVRCRWHGGNAYMIKRLGWSGESHSVLEYAPSGAFAPLPGFAMHYESRGMKGGLSADAADHLLAASSEGKTSWLDDAPARISAATGLTPSEAAFLWAGCPNANDHSQNFLEKELREAIGLKAAQAAIARDGIRTIPIHKRVAVIDEVVATVGVAGLIDGRAVDAFADVWKRSMGVRVAVPEELIADADRELEAPMTPGNALKLIAAGSDAPELTVDGLWALDKTGDVIRVGKAEPLVGQTKLADDAGSAASVFTDRVLHAAVMYIPFLFAELPVGNDLRTKAALAYELIGQRLANPSLWCTAGQSYLDEAGELAMDRLLDGLGDPLVGFDDGYRGIVMPGAAIIRRKQRAQLQLQPATLDAKAATTVGKVATQITQWGHSVWRSLQYFRSPGLAQIVERITTTPVPAGGWEQNPALSVPKLVAKAAKHLGVSAEAATVYLQYLVLLWPTGKNLAQWNGWKPKQVDAALAELVAKELLLEAKRERAQRGHFLPGGWEALKSPHPVMESWKVALYGTRNAEGDPVPPLGRFLALAPFHAMFEAAWERVTSGDVPRYEEVKR